jgi:hypothetical protein
MAFNSHHYPLGEQAHDAAPKAAFAALLSSIRTLTVGSGISPDLLTLRFHEGARGLRVSSIPPVGNCTPP